MLSLHDCLVFGRLTLKGLSPLPWTRPSINTARFLTVRSYGRRLLVAGTADGRLAARVTGDASCMPCQCGADATRTHLTFHCVIAPGMLACLVPLLQSSGASHDPSQPAAGLVAHLRQLQGRSASGPGWRLLTQIGLKTLLSITIECVAKGALLSSFPFCAALARLRFWLDFRGLVLTAALSRTPSVSPFFSGALL